MKSIAIHRPNNRFGSILPSIRAQVGKLFDQFKSTIASTQYWTKSIKVGEFDKSKINIEIDGRILTVSAHSSDSVIDFWETGCKSTDQHVAFRRTFGLPFNADKSKVHTKLKSGELHLKVAYPK